MQLELSLNMVSDHAKKKSDGGVVKNCAAHAARRMLLTRLTILTRTITSAL